jgi:hypothetical protein
VVKVRTTEDLMEQFVTMNKENSVRQVFIPGKGKFTIVLQEEDQDSSESEIRTNPELKKMINKSLEAYEQGNSMTTGELLKSLSLKDFSE